MDPKYLPKTDGGIKSSTKIKLHVPKGDVCIIWSTLEDAASIRYPTEGSPLIQSFCRMIIDRANDKTLQSTGFVRTFLPDLSEEIRSKYGVQIDSKNSFAKSFYFQVKGKTTNAGHH